MNHKSLQNWFLYIVETKNNKLYTGISINPAKRLREHKNNSKKAAKFFRMNSPHKIVFQQKIGPKGLALKIEYKIKQLPRKAKEKIIEMGIIDLDTFLLD